MTKIMLVEDDNNLREIYEARLKAEGFEIVAAPDGEAALALAAQEHPDLIITDVMMPKISGFEMLDILRNTEGLRNVKVIMLTALGQAEDNERAKGLGADRYLVKSQVTLEDIIKAAHDVIEGEAQASSQAVTAATGATPTSEPVTPAAAAPVAPAPAPAAAPVVDMPIAADPAEPVAVPAPAASVPEPAPEPEPAVEPVTVAEPPVEPPASPESVPEPPAAQPEPVEPAAEPAAEASAAGARDAVSDTEQAEAPASVPSPLTDTVAIAAPSADAEENTMRSQIDQFLQTSGTIADAPASATPGDNATPAASDDNQAAPADDSAAPDTPATDFSANDPLAAHGPAPSNVNGAAVPTAAQPVPASDTPAADNVPATAEEDSTEIAQDDAAPDMGQFAVHQDAAPAAAAAPAPIEAAEASPDAPTPDQAEDDKVVSSAINDMLATTGTGEKSETVEQQAGAGTAPEIKPASSGLAPAQPGYSDRLPSDDEPAGGAPNAAEAAPDATGQAIHGGGGSLSSRVLQPLSSEKPDINQLLSVEEAKTGAAAASAAQAPPSASEMPPAPPQPPVQPPSVPGTPPGTPPAPPSPAAPNAPGTPQQGVDPGSISL